MMIISYVNNELIEYWYFIYFLCVKNSVKNFVIQGGEAEELYTFGALFDVCKYKKASVYRGFFIFF